MADALFFCFFFNQIGHLIVHYKAWHWIYDETFIKFTLWLQHADILKNVKNGCENEFEYLMLHLRKCWQATQGRDEIAVWQSAQTTLNQDFK